MTAHDPFEPPKAALDGAAIAEPAVSVLALVPSVLFGVAMLGPPNRP